ncbi:MAG: hypothetical protein J7K01_04225 [Thermovirga sp.]|nr:hypothetical protein [Thermovirga sp.]
MKSLEQLVSKTMVWGLAGALFIISAGLLIGFLDKGIIFPGDKLLLNFGLMLLLITPLLSILACLIFFLRTKEWVNAIISLVTMVILLRGILQAVGM